MLLWRHNPLQRFVYVRDAVCDLGRCFVSTDVGKICRIFRLIIVNNKMVRACEVNWCENSNKIEQSIHLFPPESDDDISLRRAWMKFVQVKRANFPHPVASSVIHQHNFRTSSYQNWGEYQSKFAKRLILCKGAVASIQPVTLTVRLCKSHPPQAQFRSGSHPTPGTMVYSYSTTQTQLANSRLIRGLSP